MPAPRKDIEEKVRQWLLYASDDLTAARHVLTLPECPGWLVANHAQQAAEKALKGFLVHHVVDFPFTHDIRLLLDLCSPLAEWAEQLRDAEILTQYAVSARYPGVGRRVAVENARRASDLAGDILTAVRQALGDDGVDL